MSARTLQDFKIRRYYGCICTDVQVDRYLKSTYFVWNSRQRGKFYTQGGRRRDVAIVQYIEGGPKHIYESEVIDCFIEQ